MKMRIHILRLVSVFFIVMVLVGCGIAVIFYIDSYIDTNENDTPTTLSGTYRVTNDSFNNLALIEDDTGPSLWLGYVVSDSSTLSASGSIISKFNETYVRRPNGRTIDPFSESDPAVLTLSDNSYALFQFSDTNRLNDYAAPLYHATAVDHTSPEDTFTITKSDVDATHVQFTLAFDNAKFVSHIDDGILRRYDGTQFRNDVPYSEKGSFPDYFYSKNPSNELYCHIFAAITVTEGSFSNIYWTNLAYLGVLQLD